jgi:uncharacterized protein
MPIRVNLRHLEAHEVHLQGELSAEDLNLEVHDQMIEARQPLKYDLEVQKLEHNLLAQGSLSLVLDCKCVRCLKPFEFLLELDHWTVHLPLLGEEAVPVLNDCVDLTPYIREDILLEFPQHPLCAAECRGLPHSLIGKGKKPSTASPEAGSSAWAELNKLKLKD